MVHYLAAKSGCGKTTILMHECAGISGRGYSVHYVNMDCGAGDVKHWHEVATAGRFSLITPQFFGAQGIAGWITGLEAWANSDHDLSKQVVVVDTLKKIADLMHKARAKHTMTVLRALTAKGATIICAAHCNKHRDADGKLVFEGVGDIEADCDNLLYLESDKETSGDKLVTAYPSDKVRGVFSERTWRISQDRAVSTLEEAVDVTAMQQQEDRLDRDLTAIEIIVAGIGEGHHKRKDLFQYAKDSGIGKREFDSVLRRYTEGKTDAKTAPRWKNERQLSDGSAYYVLVIGAHREGVTR